MIETGAKTDKIHISKLPVEDISIDLVPTEIGLVEDE